ncbi:MAG TPA: T9SS type A sorting domain-containing protein [Bacteroidales bacterium]|nr:T9SS type A sorting domain-containing protein [Bacteroidales bacterium]
MRKLSLLLLFFLLLVPLARGQVTIGATDYGSDLQSAINAAADNDHITITGTLSLNGNVDLGGGVNTLTIDGESSAKIIFTAAARFIFEQAKTRTLKNLVIDGDSVADRGGVIKMGNAANLTLDGVTIDGGRSGSHGGAIAVSGSTLTLRNSTLSDNRSALSGGAIFAEGNSSVSLYGSKFLNNRAAAFADGADGKGAAIAMIGSNTPGMYAEGCLFYGNYSRNHGGVFIFENSTGLLVNCTLAKNKTLNAGGVAFLWGPVHLKFVNSTLAYNTTGGNTNSPCIKNIQNTNVLEFDNCILYENRDENGSGNELDIQSDVAHTITVNNSILSGYTSNLTINGTGNITGADIINPGLASDINTSGVLSLSGNSQAVNLGNGSFLTTLSITTDQSGKTRNFAGGKVDAGAYELNASSGSGFVTLNGTGYGADFGGAMIAATNGDTVKVFGVIDVTSSKDIDAGGNRVVIKGYDGATFRFSSAGAAGAGSRFVWANNANTGVERTFIDIDFIGDPKGQADQGAIITMTKPGTLNLVNVTMTGGYTTAGSGGAIRITSNGAILNATHCTFSNNKAWSNGGAIYVNNNALVVARDCRFLSNQAALRLTDGKGGAIAVNASPLNGLWADKCAFIGNRSFNHGGVFIFENSKATVMNSTIYGDTCKNAGAVAFIWNTANVTFINNTVAFNVTQASVGDGPGLKSNQAVNSITIRNCFFYKNQGITDGLYGDISCNEANTNINLSGTILQGGFNANTVTTGGMNIVGSSLVKPGISESLNGDYMLPLIDSTSQAVNLGDTTGISAWIAKDQRNFTRNFQFGKADAGAYEMAGVTGPMPGGNYPDSSAFKSYTGLSMSGYQGWFSAQGDGSGQNWVHYAKNGTFGPGSCVIDYWPDMREATSSEKFSTSFLKGSDTAYVYSPYIPATVSRHFRWMKEYGVDGVFMQRFVVDIMNPATKERLNQVLINAIQAAKANHRAISVMYDLSGIDTTSRSAQEYLDIIKNDWNELKNSVGIFNYGDGIKGENQPMLYHSSKANGGKPYPLVTIWGAGFNDGRKYNTGFVSRVVDIFQNDDMLGGCAVMLGVPTYWRNGGSDVVTGAEYTQLINLIKKVDIVLPWHTGRFNRTDFTGSTYQNLVSGDVTWCNTNDVDYVPVISPGFSWKNLKGDASLTGKPRENGMYYWDMAKAAINCGVKMLYTGMFDEMNEGTQIFKVDNNPPSNAIPFLTYSPNAQDHYLWISGEIRRALNGESTMGNELPVRASATGFTSTYGFTRSDSIVGRTLVALNQATSDHKVYYADPYSVPDGAPTVNAKRDTSLFRNELKLIADTIDLKSYDQYLRLVEVDASDKVVGYKAILLDTAVLGSIADSTGFTDLSVNFRPSYTQVGYTVLQGNPDQGNTYWAASIQETSDFSGMFYRTSRDTSVFNVPMSTLSTGISVAEGDYIPVIEVNSDDQVLGFKVFRITKPQIGRLVNPSTDLLHSSFQVTYADPVAKLNINTAEGYILYRTGLAAAAADLPFYGAPYSNYSNVFNTVAVTGEFKYITGQVISFIEIKDGAIVGYGKYVLNPIPQVSVQLKADPDLDLGNHSIISLGEAAPAGHKVYLYPAANPTDETPRIGLDYAEIAPLYSQQVTATGVSVAAKANDIYFLVETDAGNSVIGFTALTLAPEDISIFADPAVHKLQSTYSVDVIGKTTSGKIDVSVTPAAGHTVYISDVMAEISRMPVYRSKTANNPELHAYSTSVSLDASMGNNLIIAEYDNAGELTGIAIEEARDSVLQVYYVAETGNDANNGTKYNPYKTLEKALTHVTGITPLDSAITIHVSGTIQLQPPAVAGNGTQITGSVKILGSDAATIKAAPNSRALELSDARFYFENVVITGGNTASANGGSGVYLHGTRTTSATFKNVSFTNNTIAEGGQYGGGLRIVGANARFTSCVFEGNHGRNRGGAIAIAHGATDATADYSIVFDGCYIANNTSHFVGTVEGHGGGFFITNSEAGHLNVDIINSTIQGNIAQSAGGAMFVEGSGLVVTKIRLINSIVTDNQGQNSGNGHGIRMVGAANNTLEIYNSLLFDNAGGSDGTTVDIRNDAGTVITCQQSYVKTLATGTTLTGTYKTGDQANLGVLKAPLPAAYANSLFINSATSFAINYGNPVYLTNAGVNYDATFTERNATDGFVDAGPTEYNALKFDKAPEINNPIADVEVAMNAEPSEIDLTDVFLDRDGNPFTYSVVSNNNGSVVGAVVSGTKLTLTYADNLEGDARIKVRGTTNSKYAEDEFIVHVGFAPYVVNPVADISIPNMNGGNFSVDMNGVFADPDNDESDIALSVITNTRTDLITGATFNGKTLSYTVAAGPQGIAVLTIRAKSGIRTALTTVTVSVGIPPVVQNPISSVAVLMNSAPVTRDLSATFHDPDGNDAAIVKTIEGNTNPSLVTPVISGNTLTLTFGSNKTGQSVITVKGESDQLMVSTTFNVIVTSAPQLVVLNPIQPVMVMKNAGDSVIDLTNVFYNMGDPNAAITITVTGNSNQSLVSTGISGKSLTLGFEPDAEGAADITLHAVSGVNSIDHTFKVGVGNIDLLVVNTQPADMQISNNPDEETEVDISQVFSVVGKPDAEVTVDFSYTNPSLINAYINTQTHKLVISAAGSSTGSSVFTLTGTYGNATISTQFTVTILATGVQRIEILNVTLYPNPVSSVLYCAIENGKDVVNVQIVALTGMVVKSFDRSVIVEDVAEINVEDLAHGSYLLRINTRSGSVTRMFIK